MDSILDAQEKLGDVAAARLDHIRLATLSQRHVRGEIRKILALLEEELAKW